MNTTRRHFIRTSSAMLALPWLESLASAANPTPPKRLISICTGFGLYGPAFFPGADQAGRWSNAARRIAQLASFGEGQIRPGPAGTEAHVGRQSGSSIRLASLASIWFVT